jgi:hypothetical protein
MQNKPIWGKSLSNELGRLTQGVRDIGGNGAMIFIHKNKVSKNKKLLTQIWYVTFGQLNKNSIESD